MSSIQIVEVSRKMFGGNEIFYETIHLILPALSNEVMVNILPVISMLTTLWHFIYQVKLFLIFTYFHTLSVLEC